MRRFRPFPFAHPIQHQTPEVIDRAETPQREGRFVCLAAADAADEIAATMMAHFATQEGYPAIMLPALESTAELRSTLAIGPQDVVCGIAASGRTPFVLGALAEARARGAATIGLATNRPSAMESAVDVMIAPEVGPEPISGSILMLPTLNGG